MILKDLLNIDTGRIERAMSINVTLDWTKMLVTPRKGFLSKLIGVIKRQPYIINNLLRFTATNKHSNSHYTIYLEIKPTDRFDKLLKSKVRIFCSCNDFKYRAAYGLNKDKNLFLAPSIEKHLGIAITQKPTIVTPTRMCKHIYAVVEWLKSNLNKIDLTY